MDSTFAFFYWLNGILVSRLRLESKGKKTLEATVIIEAVANSQTQTNFVVVFQKNASSTIFLISHSYKIVSFLLWCKQTKKWDTKNPIISQTKIFVKIQCCSDWNRDILFRISLSPIYIYSIFDYWK